MRITLGFFLVLSCLLALPAAAEPYPAANCLEVAKAGDIIEDQAVAIRPDGSIDVTLFEVSDTHLRAWLLEKCYPDCEDASVIEGFGKPTEVAKRCGGGD